MGGRRRQDEPKGSARKQPVQPANRQAGTSLLRFLTKDSIFHNLCGLILI
jgi:hypothetical protein